MKTRTTCLMDWEVGYSTSNPSCYLEGMEGETGHPNRTKNNICLKVCGGPFPVTQGETGLPGKRSTHLSKGP